MGTFKCGNEPSMGFYLFLVPCLEGSVMDGLLFKYCHCNSSGLSLNWTKRWYFKRNDLICWPNDVITTRDFSSLNYSIACHLLSSDNIFSLICVNKRLVYVTNSSVRLAERSQTNKPRGIQNTTTGWGISRLTPLWGISLLTPLYPTNGLSYAPGS